MDDLIAAAPAENRLDLIGAVTGDTRRVLGGIGGQTARQGRPVRPAHQDGIAALERALDHADPRRQ